MRIGYVNKENVGSANEIQHVIPTKFLPGGLRKISARVEIEHVIPIKFHPGGRTEISTGAGTRHVIRPLYGFEARHVRRSRPIENCVSVVRYLTIRPVTRKGSSFSITHLVGQKRQ